MIKNFERFCWLSIKMKNHIKFNNFMKILTDICCIKLLRSWIDFSKYWLIKLGGQVPYIKSRNPIDLYPRWLTPGGVMGVKGHMHVGLAISFKFGA